MYILDTNVVSELMLPNPNRAVRAWASSQELTSLYLTSINEAEMRYGYEIKPLGKARERLGESVERVLQIGFANRTLPFDSAAAGVYAKLAAARKAVGRPVKRFDDLIAAVALAHDMSIATRNTQDFENAGLRFVNPWNGAHVH